MILKNARFIKNTALFIVCFLLAFWLSAYKMPLNALTQTIVGWSNSHLHGLITDTYESGSDPITFATLVAVLLVYSFILYAACRKLIAVFKR